jgi:hypothetical protein
MKSFICFKFEECVFTFYSPFNDAHFLLTFRRSFISQYALYAFIWLIYDIKPVTNWNKIKKKKKKKKLNGGGLVWLKK